MSSLCVIQRPRPVPNMAFVEYEPGERVDGPLAPVLHPHDDAVVGGPDAEGRGRYAVQPRVGDARGDAEQQVFQCVIVDPPATDLLKSVPSLGRGGIDELDDGRRRLQRVGGHGKIRPRAVPLVPAVDTVHADRGKDVRMRSLDHMPTGSPPRPMTSAAMRYAADCIRALACDRSQSMRPLTTVTKGLTRTMETGETDTDRGYEM